MTMIRSINLSRLRLFLLGAMFTLVNSNVSTSQVILDNSFGTNGSTRTWIPGSSHYGDFAYSVALQSDGKIIAAGASRNGSLHFEFAVARFNSDGTLDTGFGNAGATTNSIPGGGIDDEAQSVVIQPDGKIVTVGYSHTFSGYAFGIARYDSTGPLDGGFGTGGTIRKYVPGSGGFDDEGYAVLLQPDGKIIAVGNASYNSGNVAFTVLRFNSNGTPDYSFDTTGAATAFVSGGASYDYASAATLQPDGMIIAGGSSWNGSYTSSRHAFALARFKGDGTLDSSFGTNGSVRLYIAGGDSTEDWIFATGVQSDGKILAAGRSHDADGHYAIAVARFKTDGAIDTTYGTNGMVRAFISGGDSTGDGAVSAALQPDGKLVVAGSTHFLSGHSSFALARFNNDGSLDNTFGANGTTSNYISGGNSEFDFAHAVAIQSDRKIVAAGGSDDVTGYNGFALARYMQYDLGLSVSTISFSARVVSNCVMLSWKTASEIDNAGFNVSRKAKGESDFKMISSYTNNPALVGMGTSTQGRSYSFVDKTVSPGQSFVYKLESVSTGGYVQTSNEVSIDDAPVPVDFVLNQNYPNPFNPWTVISYQVPAISQVTLKVYDVLGEEVATLVNETKGPGEYSVNFDGSKLPSGIYFYRIDAGNFGAVKKLVLMK